MEDIVARRRPGFIQVQLPAVKILLKLGRRLIPLMRTIAGVEVVRDNRRDAAYSATFVASCLLLAAHIVSPCRSPVRLMPMVTRLWQSRAILLIKLPKPLLRFWLSIPPQNCSVA